MKKLICCLSVVFAMTLTANSSAETEATYVVSVHDLLHEEADQNGDGRKVLVRGYLSQRANIYIYPTKDQALIGDFSGILVSDSNDLSIHANCLHNYVEIIGRVGYTESRVMVLLPLEVTTLSLEDHSAAGRTTCWAKKD